MKPTKKAAAKKAVRKVVAVKKTGKAQGKPIGMVTHFYGNIKVAIVKFKKPVKTGSEVHFCGATTDFSQKIESMQYNHQPVAVAKKGLQVGIKVKKRVREGDEIYEAK